MNTLNRARWQCSQHKARDSSHASYFYAGHQWALAVDAAMHGSAYRPDLFEGEFPTDWQAVLALGGRLRNHGGWIGIPLVPTDCICSFISLCASLDDPPGQEEGILLKDDSVGLRALELLLAFKKVSHPNSLSWSPIHMLNHMSIHDDVVYCPLTFTYTNYSRDGYAATGRTPPFLGSKARSLAERLLSIIARSMWKQQLHTASGYTARIFSVHF
jgi:hypothetical protein